MNFNYDKRIVTIREAIPEADLWGQLAEEACELAQAALKMQRYLREVNPPRKELFELIQNVREEFADVDLCREILDYSDYYENIQNEKLARWVSVVNKV